MANRKTRLYRCSDEDYPIILGECDPVLFPYQEDEHEPEEGRILYVKFAGFRVDSETDRLNGCVLSFYTKKPIKDLYQEPVKTVCLPKGISRIKGFPQFALWVSMISREIVTFKALRRRHL